MAEARLKTGRAGTNAATVAVSGYMIRHPVAGNVLAYFQYLVGLSRLGFRVVYIEESGWPYSCYDPSSRDWKDHPEFGLRLLRRLVAEHDLDIPIWYVNRGTGEVSGTTRIEMARTLAEADLLLNIGGVCWLPEFDLCRRRALIDLDPLFTQVDRFGAKLIPNYHVHFSVGANIGRDGCTIPTAGVNWIATLPPVVPELWQIGEPPSNAPFTTIANWSAYGGIEYEGEEYGQKDREFLRLLDLPRRTPVPLELALSGAASEVMTQFRDAGWAVRDAGAEVSVDIETYRSYIAGSRGELSPAKHAYVKTRSGWFSDRSVCYLAAGRPVILQDTGFTSVLPTGLGVLAFSNLDEAVDCLDQVTASYDRQRRGAAELAASVFSYRVVLPKLIDRALGSRPITPSVEAKADR